MKHTQKTLLSIAIIASLPFTANATQTIVETNTPAAVGANGTVNRAATSGPYQTATIGEHDDEHIATTAYVKGAYNDAIAAVNKVDDNKQDKLVVAATGDLIVANVLDGLAGDDIIRQVIASDVSDAAFQDVSLVNMLLSAEGVIAATKRLYQLERVEIYTTWNTNDTTGVSLKSVYDFE